MRQALDHTPKTKPPEQQPLLAAVGNGHPRLKRGKFHLELEKRATNCTSNNENHNATTRRFSRG